MVKTKNKTTKKPNLEFTFQSTKSLKLNFKEEF